jgi:hypothetical protein
MQKVWIELRSEQSRHAPETKHRLGQISRLRVCVWMIRYTARTPVSHFDKCFRHQKRFER